jgi:hypothetical protein
MIETKLLEIRDRMTFVPALAVRVRHEPGDGSRPNQLIARGGFHHGEGIYLIRLADARAQVDPYEWLNDRTHKAVHLHLIDHWSEVKDGELIDARVILGEETVPAETELR